MLKAATKPSLNSNAERKMESDRGLSKFPNAMIASGMPKTVYGAVDNFLFPNAVDAAYPAPIGTSNLQVASSELKGSELQVTNYDPASLTFENFIVQTGNPARPYLRTTVTPFLYEADYVNLEIGTPGVQWGLVNNRRTNSSMLNDWIPQGQSAGWKVQTLLATDKFNSQDTSESPGAADYTVTLVDHLGNFLNSANSGPNGDVTNLPFTGAPANEVCYFQIQYNRFQAGDPTRNLNIKITDTTVSVARSSPLSPTCLSSHGYGNYDFIANRSTSVRQNSCSLVMTSTIAELYQGGNILMGKIVSSICPFSLSAVDVTWEGILYAQKVSYLSNLEFGGEMMWFPEYNEWVLSPKQPLNPFTANTVVNVAKIIYPSPNGVAIPSLPIQIKINGWVDYTTNDTTIPTTPGIVFIDDWLTTVSVVEACYRFTDNPTHLKVKEMIKKAVGFIMSGDPYAVAIRKAGGMAIKTALGAGLALL